MTWLHLDTFKEYYFFIEAHDGENYIVQIVRYGQNPNYKPPEEDETDIGHEPEHQNDIPWRHSDAKKDYHPAKSIPQAIHVMNRFLEDPWGIERIIVAKVKQRQVFNKNLPSYIPVVVWRSHPPLDGHGNTESPLWWPSQEVERLYGKMVELPKQQQQLFPRPQLRADQPQPSTVILNKQQQAPQGTTVIRQRGDSQ